MFKKIENIEIPLLLIATLLCVLAHFVSIPFIAYLVVTLLIALYFNPLKTLYLLQSKEENRFLKSFATIVISISILISFMMLTSGVKVSLSIIHYLLIAATLFLLYRFMNPKNKEGNHYRNTLFINLVLLAIPLLF